MEKAVESSHWSSSSKFSPKSQSGQIGLTQAAREYQFSAGVINQCRQHGCAALSPFGLSMTLRE